MAISKGKRPKRERLSCRLPVDLVNRLRDYSDRNNYILTSVVEDFVRYGLGKVEDRETKGVAKRAGGTPVEATNILD